MKCIAKILLFCTILSLCLILTSCFEISFVPVWKERNSEFQAIIMDVSGKDALDFEITKSYDFRIAIYNGELSKYTHEDIQIEYDESNIVVEYMYTSEDRVYYSIYPYEFATDGELKITYKGETITVKYNVVDYDFEANDYIEMDSIDDLDQYPEIKDMILSIKRYEYEESTAMDFDEIWDVHSNEYDRYGKYDVYDRYCQADANDTNYISTDYLLYLPDSVYYPSKFDTVKENRVSSASVNIYLPQAAQDNEGGRIEMKNFSLCYSVCDPCCTANYPLTSMSFEAEPIDIARYIMKNGDKYPSPMFILLENYPEKFFQYKLDDLTVYILCEKKEGASAYFFDETYFYSLGGFYDQRYK